MAFFHTKNTWFNTVNIFSHRYYSSPKADRIYQYLQSSLDNYEDVNFMPLRVKSFIAERAFSKAPLTIVQYLRDRQGNIRDPRKTDSIEVEKGIVGIPLIPFRSVFYIGFEALNSKVEKRPIEKPLLSISTETFTFGFLYEREFHESCLQSILKKGQKEGHINVVMANHLFSRLAGNNGRNYFVTNDVDNKYSIDRCPCARNCGEEIIFDNTGIGRPYSVIKDVVAQLCDVLVEIHMDFPKVLLLPIQGLPLRSEFLWYGSPDIMILPFRGISGIFLPVDSDVEDEEDLFEELVGPDIEVKSSSLRTTANIQQIVAMAITFSMFQKVMQSKANQGYSPKVTLIPVIAANAHHFDIYLYDSKYDILLRNFGQPIPLWDKVQKRPYKLNQSSILKLWMVINHMSMQPSLNDMDVEMLSGTAGILSHFSSDELEEIEESLRMARHFAS